MGQETLPATGSRCTLETQHPAYTASACRTALVAMSVCPLRKSPPRDLSESHMRGGKIHDRSDRQNSSSTNIKDFKRLQLSSQSDKPHFSQPIYVHKRDLCELIVTLDPNAKDRRAAAEKAYNNVESAKTVRRTVSHSPTSCSPHSLSES